MSRYYHFNPPIEEDYDTEEEFQEAMEAWEMAEDDWAEEYMEQRRWDRD